MQTFKCHKVVEAMKIARITRGDVNPVLLGELGSEVHVTDAYLEKHEPQVGGYYVRYENGYESWSPADAFEQGYRPVVEVGVYPLKSADEQRLTRSFQYHAPKGDQAKRYELLRARAREFAQLVLELCPDSRERSLALTEIEDAVMHANAAIARNE